MAGDNKYAVTPSSLFRRREGEEKKEGDSNATVVKFEDMLKANGGVYEKGDDWASHVVTDGNLVTGQNPASSEAGAKALLDLLQ